MQINILARNYEASDKLKDVIRKKVSKLEKYFEEDSICKVYLKKENKTYKMELTIDYKGNFMRAEVSGDNFYDNVDLILPKIEKQIYKYRTRLEKKLKHSAFKENNIYDFSEEDLKPETIVKTKYFNLKPMSVEDAISELNLTGHSFYLFMDENSQTIKLIYKRDDGDIGLIIPN